MAINALMDGMTYNDVSAITATDGSATKNITLSETGVIDTPTATKTIDSNGTYDVTNFASAVVNVSGGSSGGSFASGNFTPSENTYSQTINTGLSEVHGFALYITSSTATSVRTCSMILYDPTGGHAVIVGSNTAGSAIYSSPDFRNIPDSGTKLYVTISGGTISITTSDNSGTGYFVPAQYKWFAW